jgi:hypothetical protein
VSLKRLDRGDSNYVVGGHKIIGSTMDKAWPLSNLTFAPTIASSAHQIDRALVTSVEIKGQYTLPQTIPPDPTSTPPSIRLGIQMKKRSEPPPTQQLKPPSPKTPPENTRQKKVRFANEEENKLLCILDICTIPGLAERALRAVLAGKGAYMRILWSITYE